MVSAALVAVREMLQHAGGRMPPLHLPIDEN